MIKPSRAAIARIGILLLLPWALSCGDFFPSTTAITSISVSPSAPSIKQGTTQQFTAMAVLGNNQTKDVTTQVNWTSSTPAVATIDPASGLATASATAADNSTTTIQAQSGSVKGSTVLTVSSVTITSIDVTAAGLTSIPVSGTVQLTATANRSDGTTADITNSAAWTTSSQSIASVNNTGLVTGQGMGTATIRATSGGVSGTISITVGAF